ncbi:MAG TPA: DUF1156 domain-containing protein [Aggregatilinea sp.]|uniref:DUF1156 domain-containing protein n=1 Tax=Aggregatilinea sp. TaxID=2806333 RepID=UPI002C2B8346|nr:DUF1156 domain-containing protein [Aggregatilinea sp.]HML20967.1 DUF1156 domain-containing protein [Aggregatilinea sp.]
MTPRKKLIEVALPLEAINVASAREKSIRHGHPSTLHLWWARRPLAACRAVIFTSLIDDPDDPNAPPEFVEACRKLRKGANASVEDTPRQRLFDFIELLVQWESTTNEEVLETARELIRLSTDGNPPPLLDPFAGGGSIPLEAQRLGLEAHASDLNPVAVMINKALIEIPPRFANQPPVNPRDREKFGGGEGWRGAHGLAADVRYYGEWMRDRAWERIGHLYPKGPNGETVIAWLWARTVKCPNPACGAQMPLISSFDLSKKKGRQAWVEPEIDRRAKTVHFRVHNGVGKAPNPPKIGRGAKFQCLVCGEIAPDQHIKDEGMAGRMGAQLMAIVTDGKGGRNYYTPTRDLEQAAQLAQPGWRPSGELADDPRNIWCKQYGLIDFADLFTPRQLVALITLSDLVSEARTQIRIDAVAAGLLDNDVSLRDCGSDARAYAEAVSVYLAFAVDRLAEKCNTLSSWQNTADFVRGVFARQAIAMVWDYADVNPFSSSTGNFGDALVWIAEVLESNFSLLDSNSIDNSAKQADATQPRPEHNSLMISTDPPYYDNIGYADLSDFFYIWMRRSLQAQAEDIFGTLLVPKTPELIASPYRFDGNKSAADRHFEDGLLKAFIHVRRMVHPNYPLSVYYAFKQSESTEDEDDANGRVISSTGWETMLEGLIRAGFTVDGTWPMRTERGGRTNSLEANALASSIVLVCRPRPDDAPQTSRREFVNALRREVPIALKKMQSGSIAPVDLAQASIGPGMAVYSRYNRVLEADGSPLTVRTALQLINQELDAFLAETEGDVDADTRFCINWFEQFGFKEDEFGRADVLARAKNTSVDGLVNAGVIAAGAGKVRLYQWHELDPGWTPQEDKRVTVWECVHHLIERINTHGESGAAVLLMRMHSDLAAEAKMLAYRLYQICDRKGWAEYALEYNALVLSWPRLQELANELKQNQPPEQLGLF